MMGRRLSSCLELMEESRSKTISSQRVKSKTTDQTRATLLSSIVEAGLVTQGATILTLVVNPRMVDELHLSESE